MLPSAHSLTIRAGKARVDCDSFLFCPTAPRDEKLMDSDLRLVTFGDKGG